MTRMKGIDSMLAKLRRLSKLEADRAVSEGLFAAANVIQVEAQLSITEGAVSGKRHEASKPGEAPNANTHVLANNIQTIQTGRQEVRIVSDAPYSVELELGTSKMEARPFMSPALHRKKKEAIRTYAASLRAGIRRATK
jgi:HK97 gp10 family phage protein